VIAGIALVAATGIQRLDPIVALLVAANIVVTGARLVRRSIDGLMTARFRSQPRPRSNAP